MQNADSFFGQLRNDQEYCTPTRQLQMQGYATLIRKSPISVGYLEQKVGGCATNNLDLKSFNLGVSINVAQHGKLTRGSVDVLN